MNRRRFILAGAAAAAVPGITLAQTTPVAECSIGFVNGLLSMSPDCPLLTPPGIDAGIAPPSHLTMAGEAAEAATDAGTAAQDAAAERQLELQERRGRKDDKKNRRRDKRREQRTDATTQQQEKKERRRERRDIEGCEDFDTQEEAQAFYDSVKYDRVLDPLDLDRDDNDVACDERKPKATPTPDPLDG